jgi:hypothetical protein
MLVAAYQSGMVRYSSIEELAAVDRVAKNAGLTAKRVKVNNNNTQFITLPISSMKAMMKCNNMTGTVK